VPLHTLRAISTTVFAEAFTTYGAIGVKVWVFKGEVFDKGEQAQSRARDSQEGDGVVKQRLAFGSWL